MKYNSDVEMLNDALSYAKLHLKRSRKDIAKISGVKYDTIGLWSLNKSRPTSFMLKSVISACGYHVSWDMEKKK
ncbi:MAG: hypothetical protein ACJASL_000166 [Paraglaciecola sp.]|jgi:hypothetical protein